LEKELKKTLTNAKSRLEKGVFEISSRVKSVTSLIIVENECAETTKAFYILTILLLTSLIFLSPDKIPQMFAPFQTDTEIIERLQGVIKLVKKLMPNIG